MSHDPNSTQKIDTAYSYGALRRSGKSDSNNSSARSIQQPRRSSPGDDDANLHDVASGSRSQPLLADKSQGSPRINPSRQQQQQQQQQQHLHNAQQEDVDTVPPPSLPPAPRIATSPPSTFVTQEEQELWPGAAAAQLQHHQEPKCEIAGVKVYANTFASPTPAPGGTVNMNFQSYEYDTEVQHRQDHLRQQNSAPSDLSSLRGVIRPPSGSDSLETVDESQDPAGGVAFLASLPQPPLHLRQQQQLPPPPPPSSLLNDEVTPVASEQPNLLRTKQQQQDTLLPPPPPPAPPPAPTPASKSPMHVQLTDSSKDDEAVTKDGRTSDDSIVILSSGSGSGVSGSGGKLPMRRQRADDDESRVSDGTAAVSSTTTTAAAAAAGRTSITTSEASASSSSNAKTKATELPLPVDPKKRLQAFQFRQPQLQQQQQHLRTSGGSSSSSSSAVSPRDSGGNVDNSDVAQTYLNFALRGAAEKKRTPVKKQQAAAAAATATATAAAATPATANSNKNSSSSSSSSSSSRKKKQQPAPAPAPDVSNSSGKSPRGGTYVAYKIGTRVEAKYGGSSWFPARITSVGLKKVSYEWLGAGGGIGTGNFNQIRAVPDTEYGKDEDDQEDDDAVVGEDDAGSNNKKTNKAAAAAAAAAPATAIALKLKLPSPPPSHSKDQRSVASQLVELELGDAPNLQSKTQLPGDFGERVDANGENRPTTLLPSSRGPTVTAAVVAATAATSSTTPYIKGMEAPASTAAVDALKEIFRGAVVALVDCQPPNALNDCGAEQARNLSELHEAAAEGKKIFVFAPTKPKSTSSTQQQQLQQQQQRRRRNVFGTNSPDSGSPTRSSPPGMDAQAQAQTHAPLEFSELERLQTKEHSLALGAFALGLAVYDVKWLQMQPVPDAARLEDFCTHIDINSESNRCTSADGVTPLPIESRVLYGMRIGIEAESDSDGRVARSEKSKYRSILELAGAIVIPVHDVTSVQHSQGLSGIFFAPTNTQHDYPPNNVMILELPWLLHTLEHGRTLLNSRASGFSSTRQFSVSPAPDYGDFQQHQQRQKSRSNHSRARTSKSNSRPPQQGQLDEDGVVDEEVAVDDGDGDDDLLQSPSQSQARSETQQPQDHQRQLTATTRNYDASNGMPLALESDYYVLDVNLLMPDGTPSPTGSQQSVSDRRCVDYRVVRIVSLDEAQSTGLVYVNVYEPVPPKPRYAGFVQVAPWGGMPSNPTLQLTDELRCVREDQFDPKEVYVLDDENLANVFRLAPPSSSSP